MTNDSPEEREIAMSENKPVDITDHEFEQEVLKAKGISVVDFWAPWCGPCHQMAPAFEAFAGANAGKVKAFKIDADDNPKTAEKYEIRTIPTVIFFKDAEPVEISVGALSETALQSKLDALLEG